ncbi:hypothetical protein F4782DRAFT_499282 [Xylaria castorea]|nr:hypothetical protein F4782DRAFT_499282 [Xylaria castorea]
MRYPAFYLGITAVSASQAFHPFLFSVMSSCYKPLFSTLFNNEPLIRKHGIISNKATQSMRFFHLQGVNFY